MDERPTHTWRSRSGFEHAAALACYRATVARLFGIVLGACVTVSIGACTKASTNAAVDAGPPPAPAVHWEKSDLHVTGHDDWKLHVDYDTIGAKLVVSGFPKGTKLVVGATEVSAEASTNAVEIFPWLGAVTIWRQNVEAGAFFPPAISVPSSTPLKITLPDGAIIVTTLPSAAASPLLVEGAMQKAATTGLTFEGEGEATPPHSTYFVDPARSDDVIGPALTLADVDWIAFVHSKVDSGGGTMCAFAGGKRYALEKETQTITITTRRKHEKIDEKVFAPTAGCPMVAFDERAIASPARDDVFAWIRDVEKAH
ncbi:hypothetical protein BH09MYX1_BH09MYX1_39050 [soil metagenome]